jgi:thioredoxin-like negative regulator of GroEL
VTTVQCFEKSFKFIYSLIRNSLLSQDVAPKLKGSMSVVKINTEKYTNLAARYQIQELPTLVVFRDGQQVQRISGLHTSEQLMSVLSPHLSATAA